MNSEEQRQWEQDLEEMEKEQENQPAVPKYWSVAVFFVDRAYGGPEEGGWYYDYGYPSQEYEHVQLMKFFPTREAAQSYERELNDQLDAGINKGRRPIWSVLSEGVFRAIVDEGFPRPYPQERPHYE